MSKILNLTLFELYKAIRYKAILFVLGSSLLMGLVIFSSSKEEAILMYSTLLFTDVVIMGMLFMTSNIFYERQEATLKSLVVSPVKISHIITSRIIVNTIYGLLSFSILSGFLFANIGFSFDVINFLIIIPAILVTVFFHTMLGFWLGFISKDFNSTLVNYFLLSLPLMLIPLIVVMSPGVPEFAKYLVMISPSEASNYLFGASLNTYELWKVIFSFSYLIIAGLLLFKFVVLKKFIHFVAKGE